MLNSFWFLTEILIFLSNSLNYLRNHKNKFMAFSLIIPEADRVSEPFWLNYKNYSILGTVSK